VVEYEVKKLSSVLFVIAWRMLHRFPLLIQMRYAGSNQEPGKTAFFLAAEIKS
jgi:hypothetical protein